MAYGGKSCKDKTEEQNISAHFIKSLATSVDSSLGKAGIVGRGYAGQQNYGGGSATVGTELSSDYCPEEAENLLRKMISEGNVVGNFADLGRDSGLRLTSAESMSHGN